jgi:hypothetical protein
LSNTLVCQLRCKALPYGVGDEQRMISKPRERSAEMYEEDTMLKIESQ